MHPIPDKERRGRGGGTAARTTVPEAKLSGRDGVHPVALRPAFFELFRNSEFFPFRRRVTCVPPAPLGSACN
jgi:hypothetical protein